MTAARAGKNLFGNTDCRYGRIAELSNQHNIDDIEGRDQQVLKSYGQSKFQHRPVKPFVIP
jgi:hypothetical protein